MAFQSGKLSKLAYGSYLAAALTYLLLRQNDAVGVVLFDREIRQHLPPRARPTQFRRVLDLLEDVKPGGETNVGGILHEVAERIRQRGLVILISDLIDDEAAIANGLQHFRHDHHKVIVFHVLDPTPNSTFPFDRLTRFKDMEGDGSVVTNPNSLRGQYLARMKTFVEANSRRVFLPQDQLQLDEYPSNHTTCCWRLTWTSVRDWDKRMDLIHSGLLFLLPLAAVPVILHLLSLHRLKTVEISTFRFLFDSFVQQRRKMRLLDALLAALRTLFLLLLRVCRRPADGQPLERAVWRRGGAGRAAAGRLLREHERADGRGFVVRSGQGRRCEKSPSGSTPTIASRSTASPRKPRKSSAASAPMRRRSKTASIRSN